MAKRNTTTFFKYFGRNTKRDKGKGSVGSLSTNFTKEIRSHLKPMPEYLVRHFVMIDNLGWFDKRT